MDQRARPSSLLDARAEPPVVCRKLRTKMAFGALQGVEDWRYGESTTAVYWCLVTMETGGPDDGYAHPHSCQSGRRCFIPPDGYDDILVADRGDGTSTGRRSG